MQRRAGFTLLELGVILIVLSLLLSGAMAVLNQNIRMAKQTELKNKIAVIENALLSFQKSHHRLPCPAKMTLSDEAANFGIESVAAGNCNSGNDTAGNPAVGNAFSTGFVRGGMLPVLALGLPEEYAYDPWGGRFFYAVNSFMTAADAVSPPYDPLGTLGDIVVKRISDNTADTSTAVVVLVSFGPNGHGAYKRGGVIKFTGSSNTYEQRNCSCDEDSASNIIGDYYMGITSIESGHAGDILYTFDDTVKYYNRDYFSDPIP